MAYTYELDEESGGGYTYELDEGDSATPEPEVSLPLRLAQGASKLVRPLAEYGMATAGGVIAAPANLVAPGVAEATGIGLGYMGGKQIADLYDRAVGLKNPRPSPSEVGSELVNDARSGTIMGFGGPIIGKAIGYPINALSRSGLPQKLYSSAMGFPITKKWARVRGPEQTNLIERVSDQAIKDRIPVSPYGHAKTLALRNETNAQIEKEVSSIPFQRRTVLGQPAHGGASVDDLLHKGLRNARKLAMSGEAPAKELAAIERFERNFRATVTRSGNPTQRTVLSPKELQKVKQDLYSNINFDKKSGAGTAILETMRRGVAHQAMLELEAMNPALKYLNAKYSLYTNLEDAMATSLAKHSARDIVDLGTKVLLGKQGFPLAILNMTLGHPRVKSILSFAMDRGIREGTAKGLGHITAYYGRNVGGRKQEPYRGPVDITIDDAAIDAELSRMGAE